MEIVKTRVWVHKEEVIDAVEIKEKGKIKFYSYTYKIMNKKGEWKPAIRWDNFEQEPHVDRYDATTAALIEQRECREKDLKDVVRLVTAFRRNLLAMDVSEL